MLAVDTIEPVSIVDKQEKAQAEVVIIRYIMAAWTLETLDIGTC